MTEPDGSLVIRVPNHLGDLVMSLPAIAAARPAAIVVARPLAPILPLTKLDCRVVTIDRGGRGVPKAARSIRDGRFDSGVLLTSSFSSALMFRLAGVRSVRGALTDRRAAFITDGVARDQIDRHHRSIAYWLLATGRLPDSPPSPVLGIDESTLRRWTDLVPSRTTRRVGVFPGANASSRRWSPERFAEVVSALVHDGNDVLVFGGPGERALTRLVAGAGACDLGGRTDLPLLAAGLASCDILLTNDSGPMHLAAAVGTPTVSLWGAGNPAVTGVVGDAHVRLRRADLACVPCVKNTCPRYGAGSILDNAERECLALIGPPDVLNAVRAGLAH